MTARLSALIVISLVMGSFIGLLVQRLPRHETVVWGRSACPHCGTSLSARDLVPLASWIVLRGRCRSCGATIGWFYPAVELGAVAVTLSAAMSTSGWLLWASCLFGWTLLALALIDLRDYQLPDVLSLPLLPAGLLVTLFATPNELADRVLGVAGGYLTFVLIAAAYRRWRGRDGLGYGDVKFVAALGAWVGASGLPSVVLVAALLALLVTMLYYIGGKRLSLTDRLAFGPYLSIAGWLIWCYGPLLAG